MIVGSPGAREPCNALAHQGESRGYDIADGGNSDGSETTTVAAATVKKLSGWRSACHRLI
jgi:hypothetical protein